jgi:hypothetical protein
MNTHHQALDALHKANHLLPLEIFLFTMILEKHKVIRRMLSELPEGSLMNKEFDI